MGRRNYLIEGVSGTGKTTVAEELQRRGFHVIHGDRELAYQGDPETGEPTPGLVHENHIWRLDRVLALIDDRSEAVTFFCGGSRNFSTFVDLLDGVFVLDVDVETLKQRIAQRDPDEYGHTEEELAVVLQMHRSGQDTPDGIKIDSAPPVEVVVDDILAHCVG